MSDVYQQEWDYIFWYFILFIICFLGVFFLSLTCAPGMVHGQTLDNVEKG